MSALHNQVDLLIPTKTQKISEPLTSDVEKTSEVALFWIKLVGGAVSGPIVLAAILGGLVALHCPPLWIPFGVFGIGLLLIIAATSVKKIIDKQNSQPPQKIEFKPSLSLPDSEEDPLVRCLYLLNIDRNSWLQSEIKYVKIHRKTTDGFRNIIEGIQKGIEEKKTQLSREGKEGTDELRQEERIGMELEQELHRLLRLEEEMEPTSQQLQQPIEEQTSKAEPQQESQSSVFSEEESRSTSLEHPEEKDSEIDIDELETVMRQVLEKNPVNQVALLQGIALAAKEKFPTISQRAEEKLEQLRTCSEEEEKVKRMIHSTQAPFADDLRRTWAVLLYLGYDFSNSKRYVMLDL